LSCWSAGAADGSAGSRTPRTRAGGSTMRSLSASKHSTHWRWVVPHFLLQARTSRVRTHVEVTLCATSRRATGIRKSRCWGCCCCWPTLRCERLGQARRASRGAVEGAHATSDGSRKRVAHLSPHVSRLTRAPGGDALKTQPRRATSWRWHATDPSVHPAPATQRAGR
jgi:hypothetical protein